MSWEKTINVSIEIDAPAEAVWRRVSDHEGTPTWVKKGLSSVRLLTPGTSVRGGTGAVRAVKFAGWPTVKERIVSYNEGASFEYKVISGMPQLADHLGKVSVEPLGNRSRLSWNVWFSFRLWNPLSWFAPVFVRSFGGVLGAALAELKRQVESPAK